MTEPPTPPPEGALIEDRRKELGLSKSYVAQRAGVKPRRWTDICRGYYTPRAGEWTPTGAPDDTLARMALAVRLEPGDLDRVSRHEAARLMERYASGSQPRALLQAIEDDPQLSGMQRAVLRDTYLRFIGVLTDESATGSTSNPQQPNGSQTASTM